MFLLLADDVAVVAFAVAATLAICIFFSYDEHFSLPCLNLVLDAVVWGGRPEEGVGWIVWEGKLQGGGHNESRRLHLHLHLHLPVSSLQSPSTSSAV